MVTIDLSNLQGIIHHFYFRPVCRHLLFSFNSSTAGKRFLSALLPHVTPASAGENPSAGDLLNIGLTASGLKALGVSEDVRKQFPLEFTDDPDPGVMGDVGLSDSTQWWSHHFATSDIHVIVHLFSASLPAMDAWTQQVRALVKDTDIHELLPTSDGSPITGGLSLDQKIHFGYRNGLSQPDVAWSDQSTDAEKINFRHFLLGYSTKEIRSSPPMFPSQQPASDSARDIVKDGTYSVFRWIYQDVAGFNRFLAEEAPKLVTPTRTASEAEELLAAKLMGRWRDGTPLVLSHERPDPTLSNRNDFEYNVADPDGKRCPVSAHIRVTNPRNEDLNPFEGPVPRLIRRGTPFGDRLEGAQDDGQLRGLVSLFFCSSIAGQFYKIMSWMKNNNFSPVFAGHVTEQDPFANRSPHASADFRIPTDTGEVTVQLRDFTRTLGTAFFLIPSLSSLQHLAT